MCLKNLSSYFTSVKAQFNTLYKKQFVALKRNLFVEIEYDRIYLK